MGSNISSDRPHLNRKPSRRFSSLGRRSTRRYSTTTTTTTSASSAVQPLVRSFVGSVQSLRRSIRRRRYSTADIIDEPEVSSRKESMASSNLSRDDFPIVCITEVTESHPALTCKSIHEDTPTKKLDSPTSDDSCADSKFSSKESSVILEENNLAVTEIAIELACLSPLPSRKPPAKPPRLHSRRSSLAATGVPPLSTQPPPQTAHHLSHASSVKVPPTSTFSEAVSLCARRNTCTGISRQSSFSDIASMFSIDAGEVAERLKQTISSPASENSDELTSFSVAPPTDLKLPDSVKRTLRQCKQAFSRDVNLDSIWTYAKERFNANVDYTSSMVTSSSDAILDDILGRGPVAFSQLLDQLDRMTASERAIGELFSAVDCLLRCFYCDDTSRAWTHQVYTPTAVQCRLSRDAGGGAYRHRDEEADRDVADAGAAAAAGTVYSSGQQTPDDGFSSDVGVPYNSITTPTSSPTRLRRKRLQRHGQESRLQEEQASSRAAVHACHGRDECVDISLSYRDTDTGRQVNADDLPEPTSLERRLYKQRYRPQVSLSLYETCLADRRRFLELQRFLERYDCLIQLSMVKCHLAPSCLADLTSQLVRTHGLRSLDFKMIELDDLSAGFIADTLASGSSSLKSLHIISASLSDSRYLHILNDVGNCRTLKEIDISFNAITVEGCEIIARHLAINLPLQKLKIRNNNISSRGAAILFESLHHNTCLREIDLSCNPIGRLSSLAHSLRNNDTLSSLCLEECALCDESCKQFRSLLTNKLCAVQVLQLNMNPIGNRGIEDLAEGISVNKTVTTLSLNQCHVSNPGASFIFSKMLEHHTSLVYLKLAFNRLTSDNVNSAPSRNSALSRNSTLSRSSSPLVEYVPVLKEQYAGVPISDLIDRVNRKYGSLKLHLFGNQL